MKIRLVAGALVIILAACACVLLGGRTGFELLQRAKYPDYYGWRDRGGHFPKHQFWLGFNTDPKRREIFLGRTRDEIQKLVPLIEPVPADHLQLNNYIASSGISPSRFAHLQGSTWLLEFDSNGRCTDIYLGKS